MPNPNGAATQGRWQDAPALLLLALPLSIFGPALWLGNMVYGYDFLATHVPFWNSIQANLDAHQPPLWMPALGGGMPGIAACNLIFVYPTHWLGQLAGLTWAQIMGWEAALHVALAGLGMYVLLLRLQRSRGAALLGAVFFQLSGSEISQIYGGYLIYVEAIAMVPWAFWAAHKGCRQGSWLAWGLCGLALGLQVLAGAAQLCAYTAAALALFVWAEAGADGAQRSPWALAKGLALAMLIAFLIAAPQLWMTLQYLPLAERHGYGLEQFRDGSIGLKECLVWVVPGFFGWQEPTYDGPMGDCFTSEYLGLLPWVLAGAAVASSWRREPRVRWLLGLGLAALFFAQRQWTPFYWLFRHLPVLSGFRIWSRILFLLTFAVCILAATGWDALRQGLRGSRRGALAVLGLAGLAAGAAWLLAGHRPLADKVALHGFDAGPDALATTQLICNMARESAQGALLLLPLLAGLLWLAGRGSRAAWVLGLALALHAYDQDRMLGRFVHFIAPAAAESHVQFDGPSPPPPGPEPYRVLDSTFYSNLCVGLGYESLGGIHSVLMHSFVRIQDAMAGRPRDWVNLYNVRYYLEREGGKMRTIENRQAYPRAWLVTRSRGVADDEAAYAVLADPAFDPRQEVLLPRTQDPGLAGPPPKGRVQWLGRSPQGALLRVETDRASALVLSNQWFPSWRCRVDDQPSPVLEADGGLQAVLLPAGRHQVEFSFDAGLFYDAVAASLAGLLLLVGLGLLREEA